ncbi:MAG: SUMF1/EgtB/PvdO family nonheme iron enzyme [Candidatus Cloacimonetes bacterium]|nr:SUMF1/EgtB/PvdO family nonheme iron enzyme [Candidatus Cloacimonadota bacterium]
MKTVLGIMAVVVLLLLSCSETPTRDNSYDLSFDLPEPEITGLVDISLTTKQLNWEYDLENIEGFMINCCEDTIWQEGIMISPDKRAYLDTAAAVNKHIQYKIKAIAGDNESDYVTSVILDNMMTAVDSFCVTQVSVSRFLLTWQEDHIIGEEGYVIKRKIDDEEWAEIAVLPADTQEFADNLLRRHYDKVFYQINCFVGDELSPAAVDSSDIYFPGPQAAEYEKLAINRIRLTWQDEIIGESGFYIDLLIDGICLEQYAIVPENTTEWIDESAPVNHELQYKVYAFAGENISNYTVTDQIDNTFPTLSDFSVQQQNVHQFLLTWEQDHIIGEEGYILERRCDDGEFNQIALLTPNTEEYIDDICQRDSVGTVEYRLRGYLADDYSDYAVAECTINIQSPTDLLYNIINIDRIRLSWTDNSNGEEGFCIDRKVGDNLWYHRFYLTEENNTSWLDEDVPVYENVSYRVMAYAGEYESGYLETEVINTSLPEVADLSIEPVDIHTFQINWQQGHIITEEGFILYRSINDEDFMQIAELVPNTETYTDDICLRDMLNSIAYKVCVDFGDYISNGAVDSLETVIPRPDYTGCGRIAVNQLSVHWIDNADGEDGYIIDRSANMSGYTAGIGITGENAEEWIDEDVPVNEIIIYRLRTFAGVYQSTYEQGTAIHNDLPAPADVNYEFLSLNQIEISWVSSCIGESGYKIDKKVGNEAWIEEYGVTEGETTSWIDEDAEINELISYRVYIYFEDEVSDYVLIEDIDTTIPAPTGLEYEKSDIHTIQLTWQDNSNGEEGFYIDKKVGTANWISEFACVGEDIQLWSDDEADINEDLQYRVYAYFEEFESDIVETEVIDNTFPAPSELLYEQINIYTIELNWQDNSLGEVGFKIDKKVGVGNWISEYAIVGENIQTWTDDQAEINEDLQYRVCAYHEEFESIMVETGMIDNTFPAPSELLFEQINIYTIQLNWLDNSVGEEGFKIDKKVGSGNWISEFADVVENVQTWTDVGAEINEDLQYRVYAYYEDKESSYDQSVVIDNIFPAPSDLEYEKLNIYTIQLNWLDNSAGEEGFKIDKKVGSGNWISEYVILNGNVELWVDEEAEINEDLQYRVYAYFGDDNSSYDQTDIIDNTFPPPSNIGYERLAINQIIITWQDNSEGENGYKIDKKISENDWEIEYATLNQNEENWIDEGSEINENLIYRIYGYFDNNNSNYIETDLVDTSFPIPENLELEVINDNEIRLTWEYDMDGIDGFRVEKKEWYNNSWSLYEDNVQPEIREWIDDEADFSDSYRIRAFYQEYQSDISNVIAGFIQGFVSIPSGEYTWGQQDFIMTIDYDYDIIINEITNLQYALYLGSALANGDINVNSMYVTGYYEGDENYSAGEYTFYYLGYPTVNNYAQISCNDSSFVINVPSGYNSGDFDDHPVVWVSWFGANAFAEYYGWRLPTEQEWEKAARGMSGHDYPYGGDLLVDRVNYYDNGDPWEHGTTPVGFFNGQDYSGFQTIDSASPYGCYDMSGNVNEWTDSWANSTERILRGGSWGSFYFSFNVLCTWYRDYSHTPEEANPYCGFRCVRDVEERR